MTSATALDATRSMTDGDWGTEELELLSALLIQQEREAGRRIDSFEVDALAVCVAAEIQWHDPIEMAMMDYDRQYPLHDYPIEDFIQRRIYGHS